MTKNCINGVEYTKNAANLADNVIGYAEAEANNKRNAILNTGNTEEFYEIKGKKYYVSSNGNDRNDGLSPEKPLATLESLEKIQLMPGDAVLLERNSIFRINRMVYLNQGVTYGSYGTGKKPAIYASPKNFAKKGLWSATDQPNVWCADYNYEPASNMVFNEGEFIGEMLYTGIPTNSTEMKQWFYDGEAELNNNNQYYHDVKSGKIYLYLDKGNPADVYDSIEIPMSATIFRGLKDVGNITIDNICFKYAGGFAISTDFAGDGINITNCEMGYIGGKFFWNCRVRFGNAIEFWARAVDVKVENNWIYQTHDTAVSWQGRQDLEYKNVSFSNNLFEYNNADIEFFDKPGSIVDNFHMDNNIMRFTCRGWGTHEFDGGIRDIEGVVRARSKNIRHFKNITFKNNIIDCPARQIINWWTGENELSEVKAEGTKLYVKDSLRTDINAFRGFGKNDEEPFKLDVTNYEELKAAFDRFDTTAEIKWFD